MKYVQSNHLFNGNQAAAYIAYKVNEICTLYPITPSSEMSELVESWSATQQKNIFDQVPVTFEMQSEAGVAGAMHGALQTGALTTTFTASQGLLLMQPNMFKIAAELTPNVIHVATRSIATHALSVFGDHSDIMAVRNTGYAFLGAASVQETMDFALIAQAASLASRIPFVHFFDGFRTSHETTTIETISDRVIRQMIPKNLVQQHRDKALNPNKPVLRGTAQNADVFFQSREAINPFYNACPDIVQQQMDRFAKLTGRQYQIFEYAGHPEAERVIIAMASATETIEDTVYNLIDKNEKVGVLKVRLFRPLSAKHFINALPEHCTAIAVLDKTKEPGSSGEPLYLDVVQMIMQAFHDNRIKTLPKIVGGRYGLSSKEFTPGMVKAVFDELQQSRPKNNFTIGINDDVTNLSLAYTEDNVFQNQQFQVVFYETKTNASAKSITQLLEILQEYNLNYVQCYEECDYKKSESRKIANIRYGKQPIKAPYLISQADFIGCDSDAFLKNDTVLDRIKENGTLVVISESTAINFWESLPIGIQNRIREKKLSVYIVIENDFNQLCCKANGDLALLQQCFLALQNAIAAGDAIQVVKEDILKIDTSKTNTTACEDLHSDPVFAETLISKLLHKKGNTIPVSGLPVDGTYATNSSKYNAAKTTDVLPEWDFNACTQCGACSMACPQGALRIKAYDDEYLVSAPQGFKSIQTKELGFDLDLLNYTIQVHPEQCNSCNNCVDACSVKALNMIAKDPIITSEMENWNHFKSIPETDRSKIDATKMRQQQLQEPLFKYALGEEGCGEAPYLKLLSQLFGDRMLIANATGASSIFGGALPTTPWGIDKKGRGPAWSNSLFEDNAEFGLGFRLSLDAKQQKAKDLLKAMTGKLEFDLIHDLINTDQNTEIGITKQRENVGYLKSALNKIRTPEAKELATMADSLVKQSIWIVGGDGWAYDIGYGGLDHVIASGRNVNILILDNEVYSNTGGQMSKATPQGAMAKLAAQGKQKQKKDMGRLAMCYDDVYVAAIAMGADREQSLKALIEAESFDGPSVVIAYCHSSSHGIDMKKPSQYHKAAVASGQWLLYRNDPRRTALGLNPLQLDSEKPSIPIETYLKLEKRFGAIFMEGVQSTKERIQHLQNQIDKRYAFYVRRSNETV